jgi:hypothetical protein
VCIQCGLEGVRWDPPRDKSEGIIAGLLILLAYVGHLMFALPLSGEVPIEGIVPDRYHLSVKYLGGDAITPAAVDAAICGMMPPDPLPSEPRSSRRRTIPLRNRNVVLCGNL